MSTLNAVYDLASSPPTFDFLGFLLSAERERLRLGRDSVDVYIADGPANGFREDNLAPREPSERRRMLDNIVKPLCSLLPSCARVVHGEPVLGVDFPVGYSQHNHLSHYGTDKLVQAWRDDCFPLTSGKVKKENYVTVTLRGAAYWPTRNSNARAWPHLVRTLRNKVADVRVIGDADLSNAFYRAQYYERARLNLFVNSGPHAMAASMRNANCLVFKMCAPSAVCCDADFFKRQGLPVGSQIGRENHRIVWEDDTEEILVSETLKELERYGLYH